MTDPALVAIAPAVETLIDAIDEAATSTLTGDPATIGLRAGLAFGVLALKAAQLVPTVGVEEQGAVLTDIKAQLATIKARVQAFKSS